MLSRISSHHVSTIFGLRLLILGGAKEDRTPRVDRQAQRPVAEYPLTIRTLLHIASVVDISLLQLQQRRLATGRREYRAVACPDKLK